MRWCPGCGDYAVLKAVQGFLPDLGLRRENIVFVSGIGCSSRFPYYLETYGMHSIHGRAPSIATGIATSREDLSVWVVTGDGDALSIGGNHLIHALRRNVNMTILLFNNRIYGLTKGQYSPTSETGKVTKSTPMGSLDHPFNPVSLALGAEATFVARTIDSDRKHLTAVLSAAAAHRGTSFVEIYQNCPIFNDGAFDAVKSPTTRDEAIIPLVHGEPIRFGTDGLAGLVRDPATGGVKVVEVGDGPTRSRPTTCWSTTRTAPTPRRRSRSRGSPTPAGCTRHRSASSARSRARRTTTWRATRSSRRPPASPARSPSGSPPSSAAATPGPWRSVTPRGLSVRSPRRSEPTVGFTAYAVKLVVPGRSNAQKHRERPGTPGPGRERDQLGAAASDAFTSAGSASWRVHFCRVSGQVERVATMSAKASSAARTGPAGSTDEQGLGLLGPGDDVGAGLGPSPGGRAAGRAPRRGGRRR